MTSGRNHGRPREEPGGEGKVVEGCLRIVHAEHAQRQLVASSPTEARAMLKLKGGDQVAF